MDKELLKVLIHEIFHAIESAEQGRTLVLAITNILENVATTDLVLDKIIGLLSAKGVNVAAMAAASGVAAP